jgi:gamma-butyrobetaine dioxygenase
MSLPFPPVWLRDNCPCAECRDPHNGQKLFGVNDIPADLTVTAGDGAGTVTFSDGHRSVFAGEFLDRHRAPDLHGDGRTEHGKQLWDELGELPETDWAAYLADPGPALRAVWRQGFALLHGTPTEPGTVLAIAGTFGHVRSTNYGALFDVRIEDRPNNLAFTGRAIGPHTDNPYRDPVPTLQLLHCLRNAAAGGESGLVDGFRAAALLRERHPEHFAALSRTPVTFAWSDGRTTLRAQRPMIDVDRYDRIREVRYNNRSLQPVAGTPEALTTFYAAYRAFDELLNRKGAMATFTLRPGDCVIFDNTRLLHARTAFEASGERHLQGCYADLDALQSIVEGS